MYTFSNQIWQNHITSEINRKVASPSLIYKELSTNGCFRWAFAGRKRSCERSIFYTWHFATLGKNFHPPNPSLSKVLAIVKGIHFQFQWKVCKTKPKIDWSESWMSLCMKEKKKWISETAFLGQLSVLHCAQSSKSSIWEKNPDWTIPPPASRSQQRGTICLSVVIWLASSCLFNKPDWFNSMGTFERTGLFWESCQIIL